MTNVHHFDEIIKLCEGYREISRLECIGTINTKTKIVTISHAFKVQDDIEPELRVTGGEDYLIRKIQTRLHKEHII